MFNIPHLKNIVLQKVYKIPHLKNQFSKKPKGINLPKYTTNANFRAICKNTKSDIKLLKLYQKLYFNSSFDRESYSLHLQWITLD